MSRAFGLEEDVDVKLEQEAKREFQAVWRAAFADRVRLDKSGRIKLRTKFDAEAIKWASGTGFGSVAVISQADRVALLPRSKFAEEKLFAIFGSVERAYIPAECVYGIQNTQFATTNKVAELYQDSIRYLPVEPKGGVVEFTWLPAGDYFLIALTSGNWMSRFPGGITHIAPRYGRVLQPITVEDGKRIFIDLRPSPQEIDRDFRPQFDIEEVTPNWSQKRQAAIRCLLQAIQHADITAGASDDVFGVGNREASGACDPEHKKVCVRPRTDDLDEVDIQLISSWAGASVSAVAGASGLVKLVGAHEVNRLASARRAELAALTFFRSFCSHVEDVSVGQVTGASGSWVTHDIKADGEYFDVKNARRSFSNPRAYSELTVPKFKKARVGGGSARVKILGVLSTYVAPPGLDSPPSRAEPTILGETSLEDIQAASAWAHDVTSGALTIFDSARAAFLPGWFFDYPDAACAARKCAARKVSTALDELQRNGFNVATVPLAIRIASGHPVAQPALDSPESRMLRMSSEVGLTRFSLCVWALAELVLAAVGDPSADPESIRKMVFGTKGTAPSKFPGLRYDPEEYVAAMIDVLSQVWSLAKPKLLEFSEFQLAGTGVFRGRASGGHWQTIISYCGGLRVSPPFIRCGTSPLVIGIQATCPECRRLTCEKCGYCSAGCTEGEARRTGIAERANGQM